MALQETNIKMNRGSSSFSQFFKLACDPSPVGIDAVLSHKRHGGTLSLKVNEAREKSSTYDIEFCVMVQAIKHRKHYLTYNVLGLYSDTEALK